MLMPSTKQFTLEAISNVWGFLVHADNVLLRDTALGDEEIDIKYAYQDMRGLFTAGAPANGILLSTN